MAATDQVDFRTVFEFSPTPLMLLSPSLKIADVNARYTETVGRSRDKLIGRDVFDAFPADGETMRLLRDSFQRVLRTGQTDVMPVFRYPIPLPDETAVEERFWSCSHVPIRGADGQVSFILQQTQDVTDVHRRIVKATSPQEAAAIGTSVIDRAEQIQALNESLIAESNTLRNLFMQAPSFMCLLRCPDYRFELVNTAFLSVVGQRDLVGRTFVEAFSEADGSRYLALLEKVCRTGEPFIGKRMRAEFERVQGEGPEEVFLNFVFQPVFGSDGRVAAIFVDGNDVTDHIRAEKSQSLLVRELHHRVRNTLAIVQGVMNSTARTSETIEDYQWAFNGRISSLARTHSLLTEEIQQFVSFPSLLRQEVGAYAEGADERVILEGPDVELPSQLAVPLGMTIHELTTNAFRHGALSDPRGRISVTWSVVPAKEKRILLCRWVESEGPAVTPPARHGFGSMILTRVLTQQIGAKIDVAYPPEGFVLSAEIPLDIERV